MSQFQSEVRPKVLQMPQDGFVMQTGGSARMRTIKPSIAQTLTSSYPVQAQYKVTGVPGHTHNASAVLSVLCDLRRQRGTDLTSVAGVWSSQALALRAANPGAATTAFTLLPAARNLAASSTVITALASLV